MAIWKALRPIVTDLKIWEKNSWIEGLDFLVLEGIEEPVESSNASWLLTFHSFALLVSLWKFSHFRSRLPFSGFHPRVMFFSFHFHSFFYPLFFSINCLIMHLKIQDSSQTDGWFIKIFFLAEKKRRQPCWLWKFSQRKTSSVQVSTFDQNGLFRYVM